MIMMLTTGGETPAMQMTAEAETPLGCATGIEIAIRLTKTATKCGIRTTKIVAIKTATKTGITTGTGTKLRLRDLPQE
jgi:hypothetical protein